MAKCLEKALNLEAQWFNKMNKPSSGVRRLAHAIDPTNRDDQSMFDPVKVSESIERTAEAHFVDFIKAVSQLVTRPKKLPKKVSKR